MTIFLLLFGYITILGLLIFNRGKVSRLRNRRFLILAFLAFWIISTFRDSSVGWDTKRYVYVLLRTDGFESLRYIRWEPLFKLILVISSSLSDSYALMNGIISAIIMFGSGYMIYHSLENDESAFLPVICFLGLGIFFNDMNLARQCLAMAFTCNVYTVLRRKSIHEAKWILILLFFIAFFFHRVSLISLIVLIPFGLKKQRRLNLVWVALGTFVFILIMNGVLELFFRLFPSYASYRDSSRLEGTNSLGSFHVVIIIFKLFLLFSVLALDPKEKNNREIYILALLTAISIAFTVLKVYVSLAQRTGYYIEILTILLVPKILNRYKGRTKLILSVLVYLFALVIFIVSLSNSSGHRGTVPYSFIQSNF